MRPASYYSFTLFSLYSHDAQLTDCATDLTEATLHPPLQHMVNAQPLREALTELFPSPTPPAAPARASAGDEPPQQEETAAETREAVAEAVAQRIGLANPAADLQAVVQQVASEPGACVCGAVVQRS